MRFSLSLVAAFLILQSCSERKQGEAEITVHVPSELKGKITLGVTNVFTLRDTILAESQIDSSTVSRINVSISEPTFAYLNVNGIEHLTYLTPGGKTSVRVSNNSGDVAAWGGENHGFNNYLAEASRIQSLARTSNGKELSLAEPNEFKDHISSTEHELEMLLNAFVDTARIGKDEKDILAQLNRQIIDLYNLTYKYDYSFRHGKPLQQSFSSDITPGEDLLRLNYRSTAFFFLDYLQHEIYSPLWKNLAGVPIELMQQKFPHASDSAIVARKFPSIIKEYLLAKNIDLELSMQGITPWIETTYFSFQERFPDSRYNPDLKRHFAKWEALKEGKVAPDIRANTLENKVFMLADLKGKVVYVDVWATWCGPCRDEIPHMKKLQSRFSSSDNVEFVSVSVDQNRAAWEKMISTEHDWNGTHVIQQAGESGPEIVKAYYISGIPRYILIDAEGKIIEANASRPSSGDVIYGKIVKAMKKGNQQGV